MNPENATGVPLPEARATVGLRVRWLGEHEYNDVLDPTKRALGHVLMPGHPGTISRTDILAHLMVDWLGLEEEPISDTTGYHAVKGHYVCFEEISEDQWQEIARNGWWAT